jgi:polar amino acid transport system substrate-binding protein
MFRSNPSRRAVLGVAAAVAMTVSLGACGKESGTGSSGGSTPATSSAVDSALAAKVPAAIKSAGKIIIGTDSSYAPSEYLDTDGKTVIGFDVDLVNAVAGRLGLTTDWQSAKFDAIIPGVGSGKYNIGVSSFTVNKEREAQATMVS